MLSNPGGYSIPMPWEKVRKYDPEIVIVAPCGFHVERAAKELHLLSGQAGWSEITAVRDHRVFLCDYQYFTQPSPSTLVEGIELLAGLFHPELFEVPAGRSYMGGQLIES